MVRILAFVDVLGFKSLVETVPQAELVAVYRELQEAARQQTTNPVFPDDHRRFDADAYYEDHEILRRRVVNVAMASDSIVVYAAGTEPGDALAVAAAVRGLLAAGFQHGIPLRGALTVGELDEIDLEDNTVDGRAWTARFAGLVGLGLVRAYTLEGSCEWSGAILHPELVEYLDGIVQFEFEEGSWTALDDISNMFALETEVPVKFKSADGETEIRHETYWAIDWPALTKSMDWQLTEDQVANAFTSYGRAITDDVEIKREETLAFMRRAADDSAATRKARLQRPA